MRYPKRFNDETAGEIGQCGCGCEEEPMPRHYFKTCECGLEIHVDHMREHELVCPAINE